MEDNELSIPPQIPLIIFESFYHTNFGTASGYRNYPYQIKLANIQLFGTLIWDGTKYIMHPDDVEYGLCRSRDYLDQVRKTLEGRKKVGLYKDTQLAVQKILEEEIEGLIKSYQPTLFL